MLTVPASAKTPAIPIYVARPSGNGPYPAVLFLHGCSGFDGFLAVARRSARAARLRRHRARRARPLPPADRMRGRRRRGANRRRARNVSVDAHAAVYQRPIASRSSASRWAPIAALTLIDTTRGTLAAAGLGAWSRTSIRPAKAAMAWSRYRSRIFDGDADQVTPAAPCAAMVKVGTAAGKSLTITTYPGATPRL